MTSPPLDELVQNYLEWLKTIKDAPYQTFRAYQIDLIQFLKYFLRLEKNDIPSKEDVTEYLESIKGKYNYSSYRRKVTVLRNFTKYLIESGINVPDPFISISLPMPGVNYNVGAKYDDVLNLVDSLPEDTLQRVRDKIVFSLIGKSGLTIKQLLALKIKDINLANGQIIISRNHLTFIDDKTKSLIEKYFSMINELYHVNLEDYLISNEGKNGKLPLSTRTINLIIDKTARKTNFKYRLSPTILRRLFAKHLSEKNINKTMREMILGRKCTLLK